MAGDSKCAHCGITLGLQFVAIIRQGHRERVYLCGRCRDNPDRHVGWSLAEPVRP